MFYVFLDYLFRYLFFFCDLILLVCSGVDRPCTELRVMIYISEMKHYSTTEFTIEEELSRRENRKS